jgi:serine phosphatase RsbU (regulator of sigma subunit)
MSLTYSRAGHSFPYLIRNGSAERIISDGYILGAKKHPQFESKTIQMQRGDKLLLFTDGLIETTNSDYVTFESIITDLLKKYSSRGINDFLKISITNVHLSAGKTL